MKSLQPRITIIVPCFGRPNETRRIIDQILHQTITEWEAFVIGDGCPEFQKMIDSGEALQFINRAESQGSILHCFNLAKNYGGYGYHILNMATKMASGKYLIYAGNDDWLKDFHFAHYLSEIEGTDLDMVYYNTMTEKDGFIRWTNLQYGAIGHSEIIVRTDFIRDYETLPDYSHDWNMILHIMEKTNKIKKADSLEWTYCIKEKI